MARIQPLEAHEAPLLARPLYWLSRRVFGRAITPLKVMARRPGILWMTSLLGSAIERASKIDLRLHALVQIRSAQLVGCPF